MPVVVHGRPVAVDGKAAKCSFCGGTGNLKISGKSIPCIACSKNSREIQTKNGASDELRRTDDLRS